MLTLFISVELSLISNVVICLKSIYSLSPKSELFLLDEALIAERKKKQITTIWELGVESDG